MSGADRLASGGDDSRGHTGAFAACVLEVAWSDRWGVVSGLRCREVREHAPTGVQFFNGGRAYDVRLHTTVDLVSLPALARVRLARIPALSLEVGPQLSWVTHARSNVSYQLVGPLPAPAPPRNGGARSEAQIFELVSVDPTASYRNLALEGVVSIVLEAPRLAHPPFAALRYTAGLTGIAESSTGGERRTSVIELGAGWRW